MAEFADIDLAEAMNDHGWFRERLREKGFVLPDDESFEDMFYRVFLRDVEPRLGIDKPVFLYDYPASMAALSRLKPEDKRYAERVEVYCGGIELANGFSELTDEKEQRRRLEGEAETRREAGMPPWEIDENFLQAVAKMPESAGIAFGVERLVMLLTDAPTIREVLFFPADTVFRSDGE
jgi:lysyl-tRNA synthetase class 2